jgi:hypothetical protein
MMQHPRNVYTRFPWHAPTVALTRLTLIALLHGCPLPASVVRGRQIAEEQGLTLLDEDLV